MRGTKASAQPLSLSVTVVVIALGVLAVVATAVLGAVRFAAIPASGADTVLVAQAASDFYASLVVISAFFIALSAVAAWFSTRAISEDVDFVTRRVRAIAKEGDLGEPVAIRTLDEVGALTRAFEQLRQSYLDQLGRERAANRKVQDADRAKGEFLSTVSHELRTPLNAILGFSQVLLAEIEGPLTDGQREDLRMIQSSGQHLLALFNNVLDFSALSSGRIQLRLEAVDVAEILEEVASLLEGQRLDKPVDIGVHVPDDLPRVQADPTRLRQIVMNLGTNALKFTARGVVTLEAKRGHDALLISVRDTGMGIAEDDLSRLFAEFSQLGPRDGRRGSGLGLSIVKQLVELHGGRVSVDSIEGHGSVFTVSLPLDPAEARRA
jgi:signal transduction histidine kinase